MQARASGSRWRALSPRKALLIKLVDARKSPDAAKQFDEARESMLQVTGIFTKGQLLHKDRMTRPRGMLIGRGFSELDEFNQLEGFDDACAK
jgi:hypothetical protein